MERQTWFNLWYVIFAILGVLWLRDIYVTATQVQPIAYSQFEQDLKHGQIKDIAISNNIIHGTYKNPRPDKRTRFVTTRVDQETAREIDRAVRAISETAFGRAVGILATNRTVLEDGAAQLLQKETLTEVEIGGIAAALKRPELELPPVDAGAAGTGES